MLHTIKNFTHHADIPEGALRVIPSKNGKAFLIVAANGQAIAETVPTQNPQKGMARAALLAHGLNVFPSLLEAIDNFNSPEDVRRHAAACACIHCKAWDALQKCADESEDLSKIGV